MPSPRFPIPQGTLDMLILQILSLEPAHGYGIAQRLEQISQSVVQVNQGSLYPALHRLEQKGWLQPEWEVDYGVISKNAARDPFLMTTNSGDADHENRPPSITGSSAQTIALSDTLTLIATATDDGRPKPLVDAAAGQQGVRVRWILYRGPGRVRFDPDIMSQRVYGKPATLETKVTFSVPGAYRLRAIANDGQLFSTYDVDVTVHR